MKKFNKRDDVWTSKLHLQDEHEHINKRKGKTSMKKNDKNIVMFKRLDPVHICFEGDENHDRCHLATIQSISYGAGTANVIYHYGKQEVRVSIRDLKQPTEEELAIVSHASKSMDEEDDLSPFVHTSDEDNDESMLSSTVSSSIRKTMLDKISDYDADKSDDTIGELNPLQYYVNAKSKQNIEKSVNDKIRVESLRACNSNVNKNDVNVDDVDFNNETYISGKNDTGDVNMKQERLNKRTRNEEYTPAIVENSYNTNAVISEPVAKSTLPWMEIPEYENTTKPELRYAQCDDSVGSLELSQSVIVPQCFNRYLRPYQRSGIAFMHGLLTRRKGGILGDEMGLGKTIQVIGLICALFKKKGTRREDVIDGYTLRHRASNCTKSDHLVLISAPASLVGNWVKELNTWSFLRVGKFHELTETERHAMVLHTQRGHYEVIVTSHASFRIHRTFLEHCEFTLHFYDEFHCFKNYKTGLADACRKFLGNHIRIGLTGTVFQNRFEEFYTLFDLIEPDLLGSRKDFNSLVSSPITRGHSKSSNATERARSLSLTLSVRKVISSHYLHRSKDVLVNELPKKVDHAVVISSSGMQRRAILCLTESSRYRGDPKKGLPSLSDRFPAIQALTKVHQHIDMLYPHKQDRTSSNPAFVKRYIRACEFWDIAFPPGSEDRKLIERQRSGPRCDFVTNPEMSSKIDYLLQLMDIWQCSGDKCIIFSNSVRLLQLLEVSLRERGIIYCTLYGTMNSIERMENVNNFNEKPEVFAILASIRAGGTGLSLTSANKVVIFEPSWNPAVDLQAQDRAHRICQVRDVDIYRFICKDSIDELIYMRQIYKNRIGKTVDKNKPAEQQPLFYAQIDNEDGELFGLKNLIGDRKNTHGRAAEVFSKVKEEEDTVDEAVRTLKEGTEYQYLHNIWDELEFQVKEGIKNNFFKKKVGQDNEDTHDYDDVDDSVDQSHMKRHRKGGKRVEAIAETNKCTSALTEELTLQSILQSNEDDIDSFGDKNAFHAQSVNVKKKYAIQRFQIAEIAALNGFAIEEFIYYVGTLKQFDLEILLKKYYER